jgi:hypothetical protein
MTDESLRKTLAELQAVTGAFEAYHVATFECYRRMKTGSTQIIRVELFDDGSSGTGRFWVRAKSDDGKEASGNPAPSLDMALRFVHWRDLEEAGDTSGVDDAGIPY